MKMFQLFKNKNIRDLSITVLSQLLIMIVAFVTNKFVSIKLGTTGYSIYSLVKKSAGIISGIMAFSLGIALPRYCSLSKNNNNRIMKFTIATIYLFFTIVLVSSLVLIIGQGSFSKLIFDDVSYAYLIAPMVCYSFSIAVTTLLFSYYRGTNRFYWYNISQMVYNIIMLILVFFSKGNLRLLLFLWGGSCSIFGVGFFLYEIIKLFKTTSENVFKPFSELKELLFYSAPRLIGEFALFGFTTIPLIQIAHKFGVENVYMISTPLNICGMIFPIFSFTGIILLPMVSEEVAQGNISNSSSFISKMALAYIALSVLGSFLVLLIAKYIIIIFFSSSYVDTTECLKIMVFSVIPGSIYYLYRNPLDAISKIPLNSINLVISLIVLCGMISFAKSYEFVCLAFDIAYLLLGILSFTMWIIFKNRFNKKYSNIDVLVGGV